MDSLVSKLFHGHREASSLQTELTAATCRLLVSWLVREERKHVSFNNFARAFFIRAVDSERNRSFSPSFHRTRKSRWENTKVCFGATFDA